MLLTPPPFAGVFAAAFPEHTTNDTSSIEGVGSTVTATLKVTPAHIPEVGVTI